MTRKLDNTQQIYHDCSWENDAADSGHTMVIWLDLKFEK
jgi:hypothetical protein